MLWAELFVRYLFLQFFIIGTVILWADWAEHLQSKEDRFPYQYLLHDYIYQESQRDLRIAAADMREVNNLEAALRIEGMGEERTQLQVREVRNTIAKYYQLFNDRNLDAIRAIWLPDLNTELVFPGYEKVVRLLSTFLQ